VTMCAKPKHVVDILVFTDNWS